MAEKIVVKDLYKIFGTHPEKALKLYREGLSKDDIMEKTKQTIGVADVSFTVNEGEILVIMGFQGVESQHLSVA